MSLKARGLKAGGLRTRTTVTAAILLSALVMTGCSPTVRVEAPDKPIVINLNVKIEQEVRVRVEREVDAVLKSNPGIY